MKTVKINLEKYMEDGAKVLSGRDAGISARERENLEELDNQLILGTICDVIIPTQLWSLNSSFFLGFFGPSVRTLGEEMFRKKYNFQYNGNERIKDDIEQGIKDAKK